VTLATFTVPFLIGAIIGLAVGILLGTLAEARRHRHQLQTLIARVDELERLVAARAGIEFHWPTNGYAPAEETDVA